MIKYSYLEIIVEVDDGGLKLHVEELKLSGWMESPSGGLLLGFILNSSLSLIVAMDNGERTTEPGVMLGSSSIDLICVPFNTREAC